MSSHLVDLVVGCGARAPDVVGGCALGIVVDCATRAPDIVKRRAFGKAPRRRGIKHVRAHPLTPRNLRDSLRISHEALA